MWLSVRCLNSIIIMYCYSACNLPLSIGLKMLYFPMLCWCIWTYVFSTGNWKLSEIHVYKVFADRLKRCFLEAIKLLCLCAALVIVEWNAPSYSLKTLPFLCVKFAVNACYCLLCIPLHYGGLWYIELTFVRPNYSVSRVSFHFPRESKDVD